MTAQGLADYLEEHGAVSNKWGPGSFAFFGKDRLHISHVGFIVDVGGYRMLHAGGGDRTTTTKEKAAQRDAFVRGDLVTYRKDLVVVLKPNYAKIGLVL